MRVAKWLAAVAGLALMAGVPVAAEAATRAKARVVVKKRSAVTRRVVRRRAPVRTVVRVPVVAPPVIVPGPPVYAAPAYLPPVDDAAPPYAAYRWLDDADAMMGAAGLGASGLGAGGQSSDGQAGPDFRFEQGGDVHAAWLLRDGALIVADGAVNGLRLFFFPPDTAVPFLARTPDYSYGYDRGVLAAVYDADGRLGPDARREAIVAQSRFLYERGRTLWYAARTQPPVRYEARSQGVGGGGWLSFGGRGGWRDNGDWRAYRGGIGDDRRRQRDDRYRREREDRVARTARAGGGAWNGGGYQPGAGRADVGRSDGGRADAGRAGRDDRRQGGARPDRAAEQAPPPAAYRPQPVAEAPPSSAGVDRGMAEPMRERPARRTDPAAEAAPVRAEERVSRPAPQPEERPRAPEPVAVPAPEPAPAPRAAPPPEPAPQPAPAPERPTPRVQTAEPATNEQPQ